jgi:predicted NUDIX family phosphoesterase
MVNKATVQAIHFIGAVNVDAIFVSQIHCGKVYIIEISTTVTLTKVGEN